MITILKGPASVIPDNIFLSTFPDSLSEYETGIIRRALGCSQAFDDQLLDRLIGVLSKFGCRELPTHLNLKELLLRVARYEFMIKPLAGVSLIHGGIPLLHWQFWNDISVNDLHRLYLTLTGNPAKVVSILNSVPCNANEERVFEYLQQFVGSMNHDNIRRFLRFTTGSSVCLTSKINVTFNTLSGFARRPISHTCDNSLELSSTYLTYPIFVDEFEAVLSQPELDWTMDAI